MSLEQRHRQPEWMDRPDLDPDVHARALQGLRRINGLSRAAAHLFEPIRCLAIASHPRPLRVLDLACGGGDVTLALAERCRREGLAIQFSGCDLSRQAVAIATAQAARRGVEVSYFQADALADPLPADVDVLLHSLFLHHLSSADAQLLLRRMAASAGQLVLVSDLLRSRAGYALAWAVCRLVSRSPIVHHDGPLSVQGAFRLQEVAELAAAAGLDDVLIRRCWPERYLLQWRRARAPEERP